MFEIWLHSTNGKRPLLLAVKENREQVRAYIESHKAMQETRTARQLVSAGEYTVIERMDSQRRPVDL